MSEHWLPRWITAPIEELQLELDMSKRTGYIDPEGTEDTPEDDGSFEYRTSIITSGAGIFVTVYRDSKAYASIACDSVQEAEWFKERLAGRRQRS